MTQPGRVPYRAEFEPRARGFLDGLTPRDYGRAMATVHDLVEDPYPDGRTRIRLPFPYRFGSIGYTANGFFIVYSIPDTVKMLVHYIGWVNPDYWG